MCKCEFSGRAGEPTREFQNTRPPRLCFRALLTEGGERKVSPCSWVFSGYCFPTLEARNQVNSRSRCLASRGPCVGVRAYLKPGVAVGVTQRVALSVARTPFRTVLEGQFSEVRRLVLRRHGLGTLFEGAVHLLKPLQRVRLEAPGEQRNQQTLERFSLDESNTVVF
jgi:hypothetical protein